MRKLLVMSLLLFPGQAMAASGPFFSLGNSNFVVGLSFLGFIALVIYAKVPKLLGGLLDKRAENIESELDEARALREEAREILESYDRKQNDVETQAARIVANAKADAIAAVEKAKADLKESIARRLAAAEEQIASAEASALHQVRNQAIAVAVTAAGQVLGGQMSSKEAKASIDKAIEDVGAILH